MTDGATSTVHYSTHEHFIKWLWEDGERTMAKKYARSCGIDWKPVVHTTE